jgi:hypothetical protein
VHLFARAPHRQSHGHSILFVRIRPHLLDQPLHVALLFAHVRFSLDRVKECRIINATGISSTIRRCSMSWNSPHLILLKQPLLSADLLFGPWRMTMFDESQHLQENPHLLALLSHYAQQGTEERATWRDRLMQMEGVEPKQLSVLHGDLIAFDWIEQNMGQAICRPDGTLSACYRITLNGLREHRRIHGVEIAEESSQTFDRSQPRFARKKKPKSDSSEAVAAPEESLVSTS